MPDQVNTDSEDDDSKHEAAHPIFARMTSLRLATAFPTNESSGEILETNEDITGNNQASEDKMPEEDSLDSSSKSQSSDSQTRNETLANNRSDKDIVDQTSKVLFDTIEASVETAEASLGTAKVLNETSESAKAMADVPEVLNDTSEASVETIDEAIADAKSDDEHDNDNCKHELISRTSTLIMDTGEALAKGTITEMTMADVSYLVGKNHNFENILIIFIFSILSKKNENYLFNTTF